MHDIHEQMEVMSFGSPTFKLLLLFPDFRESAGFGGSAA